MNKPQVELHIANYGVITLELDADKAPKSVANFLSYVNKGHYDNTVFHRVIPGFMIQGGGMEPGMKQKATATSQFFINTVNNDGLNYPNNGGYAVFGKVIAGTDVVDKIKAVKTGNKMGHADVPVTDVVIEKAVAL